MPAMILSNVDLPAPLVPKTPIFAPGKKDKLMFFKISRPPVDILIGRHYLSPAFTKLFLSSVKESAFYFSAFSFSFILSRISNIRWARATTGTSIILPSKATAPSPAAIASS